MGLQSLTTIVAVPSAADSWTAMSNIRVPAGAKRLSKVTVGISPDWGTTAGSVRMAPVYQILGSGLQEQSPHAFLGAFGGHAEVTTGGITQENTSMVYDVDIPVSIGSDIQCQVTTLDEVVTAGTTQMELQFDTDMGVTQHCSYADYVDATGTTSADNYASVGTLNVPVGQKPPTKIIGVSIGIAPDQGTSAISLRVAPRIQLSGAGIRGDAQAIEFLGPTGYTGEIGSTPSQGIAISKLTKFIDLRKTPIPVNPAGKIQVDHKFDVETPTASTVAVGVLYA